MSESRFEFSEAAERDLTEIYIYTHRNFGFEHASHTVFYVKIADGVRIVRVLHQAMDPERHV